MKESGASKAVHQGELMEDLRLHLKLTQEVFAKNFDRSSTWYKQNVKKKTLSRKTKNAICQAYNIPKEYFLGEHALSKTDSLKILNEEPGAYRIKYNELEEKYKLQSNELLNLYRENKRLNEEITKLLREKKSLLS